MNGLDLFSGIGGISLALKPWVTTVAYCERDRYAQGVLLSRMLSGDIDRAPIWDDVTSLRGAMLPRIDIISGGFPCQDISVAGRGVGLEGQRSGLFFEIVRLVCELRPRFIFLENVPAITVRGLDRVLLELTALGYDCRWTIVSASEVGAHHQRDRWWLLAHAHSFHSRHERQEMGLKNENLDKWASKFIDNGNEEYLANSDSNGWNKIAKSSRSSKKHNSIESSSSWPIEPTVGRVANGIPNRMDRLKCLGNSVVPKQAREAFERLCGLK